MSETLREQLRATLWDTGPGRLRPWFRLLLAVAAGALAGWVVGSWVGAGMSAAMVLGNGSGRILTAEFDSECGECFEPIESGDSIENREGHWCHVECPSTSPGPNAARWDGTDLDDMGY